MDTFLARSTVTFKANQGRAFLKESVVLLKKSQLTNTSEFIQIHNYTIAEAINHSSAKAFVFVYVYIDFAVVFERYANGASQTEYAFFIGCVYISRK